jgi:phosphoribosylpyrophosphate synthetase
LKYIYSNCCADYLLTLSDRHIKIHLSQINPKEQTTIIIPYLEDIYLDASTRLSIKLKALNVQKVITYDCHWHSVESFKEVFGEDFINVIPIEHYKEHIEGDVVFIGENNQNLEGIDTSRYITQNRDIISWNDSLDNLNETVTLIEEAVVSGKTVNNASKLLRDHGVKRIKLLCPHIFCDKLDVDDIVTGYPTEEEFKGLLGL